MRPRTACCAAVRACRAAARAAAKAVSVEFETLRAARCEPVLPASAGLARGVARAASGLDGTAAPPAPLPCW